MCASAMKIVETKNIGTRTQGKVIQLDYDFIVPLTGECFYCLTDAHVQMILSIVDYFAWSTRWYSESGIIDSDVILELQGSLTERLMNGCCGDDGDTLKRLTPDGHWQTSVDNGATWQDNTASDPRRTVPLRPTYPAPEGDTPLCEWADSIIEVIKTQFVQTLSVESTLRDIFSAVSGLLALVLALTGVAEIFIALTAIPAIIFGFGVLLFQGAMTDEVWDRFRCNIFSHMDGNGIGTQDQIDAIYAQIGTDETGIAKTFLQGIVALFGVQGMANAANFGLGSPDAICCPTCAPTKYELFADFIAVGQTIDYGTDYYEVPSYHAANGTSYVIVKAIDINDCCEIDHFEFISGSTDATLGVTTCGNEISEYEPLFPNIIGTGGCTNHHYFTSNTDFTIRVYLKDC